MRFLWVALLLTGCRNAPADHKTGLEMIYHTANDIRKEAEKKRLTWFGMQAHAWCISHHFNTHFVFLADMARPSGHDHFFVYDMEGDSVVCSSLVAHGCCNRSF